MKCNLAYLIVVFMLISCNPINQNVSRSSTDIVLSGNRLEIVVLDSCEYFYGPGDKRTFLTHKGNCKNSVHKHLEY